MVIQVVHQAFRDKRENAVESGLELKLSEFAPRGLAFRGQDRDLLVSAPISARSLPRPGASRLYNDRRSHLPITF